MTLSVGAVVDAACRRKAAALARVGVCLPFPGCACKGPFSAKNKVTCFPPPLLYAQTSSVHVSADLPLGAGGTRCLSSVAQLRIRSKTSRHSSEWIRRQINDRYVRKAQECHYRSRAAFKLEQLDDAFLFLRRNRVVVDLGAYPGGWSQVAARRVQLLPRVAGALPSRPKTDGFREEAEEAEAEASSFSAPAFSSKSRVIAVDKIQLEEIEGVEFIQGSVGEAATLQALLETLGERKADVVLSDLAPACTGDKRADHLNCAELCLYAADLMEQVLRLGGTFVTKIFTGSETPNFKTYLRSRFDKVHSAKPKACRPESREMYFVAIGFKGREKIAEEVQIKGSFSAREGYV